MIISGPVVLRIRIRIRKYSIGDELRGENTPHINNNNNNNKHK